ncbi:MAG: hypothetical protein IKH13_02790, partial [Clostridia bacterium]|nr:hypothetical protein [Clostridia bacterium]
MIKLSKLGTGFELSRNGRRLFSATPGTEIFKVGSGKSEYTMNRGSFSVNEKIRNKRGVIFKSAMISGDTAVMILSEGSAELRVNGDRIEVSFEGFDGCNRMWFNLPASENEHFYGTGEIFSEFDLRGKKSDVWVSEHINAKSIVKKLAKIAVGMKDSTRKEDFSHYETYYAQPTYLSSDKYYFHSFNNARTQFDFTPKKHVVMKTDSISGFCMGWGDTFEDVLADLTEVVGRQPELPDWVYDGEILGIQGGTDIMMSKVKNTLDHGMKV